MRVLLAEPEGAVRPGTVHKILRKDGYAIDVAKDEVDLLWHIESDCFDAIVVCAGGNFSDAARQCNAIREAQCWAPVLVAPAEPINSVARARVLDAGADDCLNEFVDGVELGARLRAIIRRDPQTRPSVLKVNDLSLDPARHLVSRGGISIHLHPKKFAILHELMRRPGEILSRTFLIDQLFGGSYLGMSNIIDSYVSHLRSQVDKPFSRNTIKTVRAVGYRLDPEA